MKSHEYYYLGNDSLDLQDFKYYFRHNGVDTELMYSPSGWDEKMISFARSTKYYGLIRSFSVPLQFVKDGADYLRQMLYTKGFEIRVELVIKILNRLNLEYNDWYIGEIDFSQFQDKEDFFEVNIMEGGISKQYKANEDTVFEIPLPSALPDKVKMDFIGVPFFVNQIFTSIRCGNINPPYYPNLGYSYGSTLVSQKSDSDIIPNAIDQCVDSLTNGQLQCGTGGIRPLLTQSLFNDKVTIKFNCPVKLTANDPFNTPGVFEFYTSVWACVNLDDFPNINTQLNDPTYIANNMHEVWGFRKNTSDGTVFQPDDTFSGEVTFDINQFDNIKFICLQNQNAGFTFGEPGQLTNDIFLDLEIAYTTLINPTTFDTVAPSYLFKKLVEKITGDETKAKSDFLASLDAKWPNQLTDIYRIFSGDCIRKAKDAKIKISMNDFFKAFDSMFCLGLGVEIIGGVEKLVIEERDYFFKNEISPYNFGEVKNFKRALNNDHVFNSVSVGYVAQDYDDLNGRFEFNTDTKWSLPVKKVVKDYDIISPIRADGLGMSLTWAKYQKKDTNDSDSDNDVFIMKCQVKTWEGTLYPKRFKRDESYLQADFLNLFEGVEYVKAFNGYAINVHLSPARNLIRHLKFLKSFLDYNEAGNSDIAFTSSDKAARLISRINNFDGIGQVDEKGVINTALETTKLFSPVICEFETASTIDLVNAINQHKYKKHNFTFKGVNYSGYILEISQKPAQNQFQTIKMVLA